MSAPIIIRAARLLHNLSKYSARICYSHSLHKLNGPGVIKYTNVQPCKLLSGKSGEPTNETPGSVGTSNQNSNMEDSSSSSSDSDSESSSDSSDDEAVKEVSPDMASAVDRVAESFSGETKKVKSDLLQKLRDTDVQTEAQKSGQLPPDVSSVLSTMRVQSHRRQQDGFKPQGGRSPPQRGQQRAQGGKQRPDKSFRGRKDEAPRSRGQILEKVSLFGSSPLGIFQPPKPEEAPQEPQTQSLFDEIELEERIQQMSFPPVNAFQEMILWTEQGKMWTFPIDNEQGLEQEANVGFHEHVFLDHLLEEFPKKGPVRHFMELVITGLSKNPYITVQQKHDHIEWYKNYFQDKYALIDELTVVKKKESNM